MSKKFKGKKAVLAVSAILFLTVFIFVFFINQWRIEVTLNGSRTVELECGAGFEDEGAQAYLCGSLIFKDGFPIAISEVSEIDWSKKGEQDIFYFAEVLGRKGWTKRIVRVIDTTAPEILLTEQEGFYTLPGAVYEEEGYSAIDNCDGDITAQVMREERDGVVYYTVADSSGNIAEVHREIFYDDPVAPEITLTGELELVLEVGTVFEEPGYMAVDNVDGDITAHVTATGTIDMSEIGTYTITYSVTDGYHNTANVQRTIRVEDHTPPAFQLVGESTMTHNIAEPYQDPGYTAVDNYDGDVTDMVEVAGSVDVNNMGTYEIVYSVSDSSGNSNTIKRTIVVKDIAFPDIKLKGDSKIILTLGKDYQEPGFNAVDNYDGDLTSAVKVSGSINKNKVGTYPLTYTVTDNSGNTTEVKRTVVYRENEPPKLTLKGDAKMTMQAGTKYKEPGYTATDNYDGNITSSVKVSGNVNIYRAGTYTLTYTVADSSGNKATAKRIVTVKAKPQSDTVAPNGKVIYLTFDDGPGKHTQRLLDILDKYNVKVTFFTVSNSYAYMMAKEAAAGHTVAIHSATHNFSQIYSSEEAYFADLKEQQNLILKHTGIKSTLVRFPGGSSNSVSMKYNKGIMTRLTKSLTDMGYQYFDWNVDSNDAGGASTADEVFQNVISGVKKRNVSVVLQHDIHGFSVDAVEKIIIWGLANGYTFLPMDASSPTAHHVVRN